MNNENRSKATQEILSEYRLYSYDSDNNSFIEKAGIYAPSFPVVIKSDGTVWDKAALYLNHLLKEGKSSKLLKTVACDLLDFLRFMEEKEIDMLHAPIEKELRVTYWYRQGLIFRENLSRNTASQRIARIVAFYEYCFEKRLFTKEELKNRLPKHLSDKFYKKVKVNVWRNNAQGFAMQIQRETTDLSIPRKPRSGQASNAIQDGRQLHPLSPEEQEIFKAYLEVHGSRVFQLICSIAINTGARIQPICTLRISDIEKMKKGNIVKGSLKSLTIGSTTTVDNKQDKRYSVFFPNWLVDELDNYIKSEEWLERARKSYYKNGDNYVFLSKFGSALYTSKKEIKDRKERKYSTDKNFKEKSGESVRKCLNDIWLLMKKNGEPIRKFSIHDLRATFGLNLLKALDNTQLLTQHEILEEIKERMGHSSRLTTERYLNYYARNKAYEKVSEKYTEIIYRFDN